MSEICRCRDCRGREVVLTEHQWVEHILDGHPDLSGLEDEVELVLIDPEQINGDRDDSNRHCYYRPTLALFTYPVYLKVVVEFQRRALVGPRIGTVITVFPTDRLKAKEKQLWAPR